MNNLDDILKRKLKILNIIYSAITFSVVVIVALPFFIFEVEKKEIENIFPIVFGLAAFVLLALSVALPDKFFARIKSKLKDVPPNVALSMLDPVILISCVLRETIAILGFILYILSGDKSYPIIFGSISLATLLSCWPKFDDIKNKITSRSF